MPPLLQIPVDVAEHIIDHIFELSIMLDESKYMPMTDAQLIDRIKTDLLPILQADADTLDTAEMFAGCGHYAPITLDIA